MCRFRMKNNVGEYAKQDNIAAKLARGGDY